MGRKVGEAHSGQSDSEVIVHPATIDDIGEIQRLEIDAGRRFIGIGMEAIAGDDPPKAAALASSLAEGRLLVAVDASVIVGYIQWSEVDGAAHIDQVSVATDSAGQGLGGRLIDEVCTAAVRLGFSAVTLTTYRDVPWNGPLYERYGFTVLSPDEVGPGLTGHRNAEREAGIDIAPRVAMRRPLGRGNSGESAE